MGPELRHTECPLSRIYQLRKTKTNIQILQQNVLLKQKYMVTFLRQHGPEVFQEMRSGLRGDAVACALLPLPLLHRRPGAPPGQRPMLNRSDLWGKGRWRYTPYAAIPCHASLGRLLVFC